MSKIVKVVPVKTRLPGGAWALAVVVTLASLAFGADQSNPDGRLVIAAADTTPQGHDAPGADNGTVQPLPEMQPGETLSEHLDRNQGVISPPPTGDAEIYTTAPNPDPGTTPVIPPPGSPGGDPNIQPK